MKRLVLALMVLVALFLLLACTIQNNTPLNNTTPANRRETSAPIVKIADKGKKSGKMSGQTIIIDAGHGGFDAGTQGIVTGGAESDINLDIARRLEESLAAEGAHVVMTRMDKNAIAPSKEEDMKKREDIIASNNPDITVSIHQNMYEDPVVCGLQVFYLQEGSQAEKLAKTVQKSLDDALNVQKTRKAMSGDYIILKPGTGPSIIVECGFLSNPEEDKLLQNAEYQIRIAKAIRDGLIRYLHMNSLQ